MSEETKSKKPPIKKSSGSKKKDKSINLSKKSSVSEVNEDVRPDPIFANKPKEGPIPYGEQKEEGISIRMCVHHSQPLKFYCEACEEPICSECQYTGPHNTELHRVSTVQEAFTERYNYLSGGTYQMLMEKRDRLLIQLDKIDGRIGEVKLASKKLEREVKTEYSGMLERLSSSEGTKYAVLQHDMAAIQKDIEQIDNIFDTIDDYLQGDLRGDYVGFLLKFKDLHEYIEYAVTKQFKVKIDVIPNDLPRELTERRKIIERADQAGSLLKLKDEIIWNLIQEKKKLSRMAELDLDKAVQQEWNEWARLVDKYCEELLKYQLVCSFCGVALDDLTVNSPCPGYKSDARFTTEMPPTDWQGGHYFAKPVRQKDKELLEKISSDPGSLTAFNEIKASNADQIGQLRRRLYELDKDRSGEISQNDFINLVMELYLIKIENVTKLAEVLVTGINGKIPYPMLLKNIEPKEERKLATRKIPEYRNIHETVPKNPQIQNFNQPSKYQSRPVFEPPPEAKPNDDLASKLRMPITNKEDFVVSDYKPSEDYKPNERYEDNKEVVKKYEYKKVVTREVKKKVIISGEPGKDSEINDSEVVIEEVKKELPSDDEKQKEEVKKELPSDDTSEKNKDISAENDSKINPVEKINKEMPIENPSEVKSDPPNEEAKENPSELHYKKIIDNIHNKNISKDEITKRFEEYDTENKGTISLDSFYLILMKMDFIVSNQEIQDLAKALNPDIDSAINS